MKNLNIMMCNMVTVIVKNLNCLFFNSVMDPKDGEGVANRVDPEEQSDLGLHCLLRTEWPSSRIFTAVSFS